MKFWAVEPEWAGVPCAILGCGPSLNTEDIAAWPHRMIAVNDAYLLAPSADILFFMDARWWNWHHDRPEFKFFRGIKATLDNGHIPDSSVRHLGNSGRSGLSNIPGHICHGSNSGYGALNLALQLGANPIALLGFDMQVVGGRTHWHDGHPRPTREDVFRRSMLPCFKPDFSGRIVNCTPGSALHSYPCRRLWEVIRDV